MSTRTLLNVDNYRNLLADDPSAFLKTVEKNNFSKVLLAETRYLIHEIEQRTERVDEKHWALLVSKLNVAIGRPDLVTDELRNEFPSSSEDPTAAEQSSWELSQLDPFQSERRQPFFFPCFGVLNRCFSLNPNQRPLTHHAPILGLYEPPTADNNSNYPHS